MNCLCCNGSTFQHILDVRTIRDFNVNRCAGCGFVFAAPRPTEDELHRFYNSDYFTGGKYAIDGKSSGYAAYFEIGEANAEQMWPSFLKYTQLSPDTSRRLLDVGCASGRFLYEATRTGWDAMGVELSATAVHRANEHYQLAVMEGDIFHPSLRKESFDVITLWHVLEHVLLPRETLRRAFELLKPDGLLFLELPNWNSLGRVAKAARWAQLKPPEHINFFIPRSLSAAVHGVGFKVERCSTCHVSGFAQWTRNPKRNPFRWGAVAVEATVGRCGYGGYLRLLARRPTSVST